jgi:DNA replication protein DnaC
MQNELVELLRAQNAHPRDIAYAAANIPREFWDITRAGIERSAGNAHVFDYVIEYVDNFHTRIAEGAGLTMMGVPKSGKTLFGCAILKSAAITPGTLHRDYQVLRVNYDAIMEDFDHVRSEQDSYMELRNMLQRADLLFIDSISYTAPSRIMLTVARMRRDFRKATILATSIADATKLSQMRSQELIDIFKDVNKAFMVGR